MKTIILVGSPDRHKGPLCLCKCSDCSRRSQYVPQSSSTSVLPCNDGLDTCTAPCALYEGKEQDGKCRFGPVRSTATVDNFTTLSRCRCNDLMNTTRSANVVTCAAVELPSSTSLGNPGGSSSLIELAISHTIRFVSFLEPVAIAFVQERCARSV